MRLQLANANRIADVTLCGMQQAKGHLQHRATAITRL